MILKPPAGPFSEILGAKKPGLLLARLLLPGYRGATQLNCLILIRFSKLNLYTRLYK